MNAISLNAIGDVLREVAGEEYVSVGFQLFRHSTGGTSFTVDLFPEFHIIKRGNGDTLAEALAEAKAARPFTSKQQVAA